MITYYYSAWTPSTDGQVRTHTGALTGAVRKAKAYARTYPGGDIKGYGASWRVADSLEGLKHGYDALAEGRL